VQNPSASLIGGAANKKTEEEARNADATDYAPWIFMNEGVSVMGGALSGFGGATQPGGRGVFDVGCVFGISFGFHTILAS
jgi:hypothetical protein